MKQIHSLQTNTRDEMIDVTDVVRKAVKEAGCSEGHVDLFCMHTTAGLTINENADPDVKRDMLRRFDEVYPWAMKADRHMEGNTAAHMKASTVGSSEMVLVQNGQLVLGTWQGIYFCEFDGPRTRKLMIRVKKDV
ncbi:secondary thiamine-phosphate synthase enzyme YjbQ [Salisediminibacterium beveridgei]|uniref:Secondary thiamine-phosphate synthase enzyme n=1 Tax=Salisediminibacterium beveridgei TaxID=632773 RepID=A0A1D7QSY7_9BACI|nr:secondary thiamine-phosphate synthase enzyme YjbQ [Salisediminibacterium beveridgei]AOM82113.1 hypothetical protein BBEV_0741 [Salisediminibacterium beveridgei]